MNDEKALALTSALRDLHDRAGKPSTRAVASDLADLSHTTVAEALNGKRVPSWRALAKIVAALDGDPETFRELWEAATESTSPSRIQFRPGPLASQILRRSGAGHDQSPDLVARRDLSRYYTLLANEMRGLGLTRNEALLCCEALSSAPGIGTDSTEHSPASVPTSIIDAMRLDRLDTKWDVDRAALTAKVVGWTAGQRYAVADAVEQWRLLTTLQPGAPERPDNNAALAAVGLLRT